MLEDCNFTETPDLNLTLVVRRLRFHRNSRFFKQILRGCFGLRTALEVKSDLIIGFLLAYLPYSPNFRSLGHPHSLFLLLLEKIKIPKTTTCRPAAAGKNGTLPARDMRGRAATEWMGGRSRGRRRAAGEKTRGRRGAKRSGSVRCTGRQTTRPSRSR